MDQDFVIQAFQKKPASPAPISGYPERVLASMGMYLCFFKSGVDILGEMAGTDFGHDTIPIPSFLGVSLVKWCM